MHGDLIRAQKQLNKPSKQTSTTTHVLNSRFSSTKSKYKSQSRFRFRPSIRIYSKEHSQSASICDFHCLHGFEASRLLIVGSSCASILGQSLIEREHTADIIDLSLPLDVTDKWQHNICFSEGRHDLALPFPSNVKAVRLADSEFATTFRSPVVNKIKPMALDNVHETDFNVNAARRQSMNEESRSMNEGSRSMNEESRSMNEGSRSNDVCGGTIGGDKESDIPSATIESGGNFVRGQDGGRAGVPKLSVDETVYPKDTDPSPSSASCTYSKTCTYTDTIPLFPTQWFREKLSLASSTLFPSRSLLGVQMCIVVVSHFVLLAHPGVARSLFEHLVDTFIQVALLTLLMTTTMVLFEGWWYTYFILQYCPLHQDGSTDSLHIQSQICCEGHLYCSLHAKGRVFNLVDSNLLKLVGSETVDNITGKIVDIFKAAVAFLTSALSDVHSSYQHHKGAEKRPLPAEKTTPSPGRDEFQTNVQEARPGDEHSSSVLFLNGRSENSNSTCSDDESVKLCEGTTMTENILPRNVQTMTEMLVREGMGTQTESLCESEGDEVVLYRLRDVSMSAEGQTTDAQVQTELDVKKIYEETEKSKRSHTKSLKCLQRKFLAIRRCCQKKVREMKRYDMNRGDYLAKLQLQLPALQQEKSSLIAERALIEKQFTDEKKKNRDLVNRMTKLNQQFYRLGQGYSSTTTPTPTTWRQQQLKLNNNPQFYRPPGDQQLPHQTPLPPSQHGATKMNSRQVLLPQPQSGTAAGMHNNNSKQITNMPQQQQQQPNKAIQQTAQQLPLPAAVVQQQPRLPIFQLLQNSILSNAGQAAPGFQLQCHQQLSSLTKNSTTNHLNLSTFQQVDQNASNRDFAFRKNSSEAPNNNS